MPDRERDIWLTVLDEILLQWANFNWNWLLEAGGEHS